MRLRLAQRAMYAIQEGTKRHGTWLKRQSRDILVNGINPGSIRTERWDTMMTRIAAEHRQTPAEVEAEWMRDNPLRRPGEPQEVAALAVFLASARASYINGVLVQVDGGATRCI
jgi:NAD(P)-dependent dehydrogenase (short-subunit alcohol dehydrogenase family)